MGKRRPVFQFKITLIDSDPPIWRRIQISDLCTFWSLHVAIQDAMGWQDCHLHSFMLKNLSFGIPNQELDILPGWEFRVRDVWKTMRKRSKLVYEYDFGDDWRHEVMFEGLFEKEPEQTYPRCLAGERACPPEDCGGIYFFEDSLKILANPDHPQYTELREWLGDDFETATFDLAAVRFSNPSRRLNYWFES